MDDQYKAVNTDLLQIAYLEYGPPSGSPILLLHGWPDGPQTWSKVAPRLADAGWRVLVPTLRGFGRTRFLDAGTIRSGQTTALAQDCIAFADALHLERFTLVGHDWGGRTGYLLAAFHPDRVERLITMSVNYHSSAAITSISAAQQRAYWYQWLMQTDQAPEVFKKDGRSICRELWQTWMAPGKFVETEFDETAADWNNPDWIDVTLSSYRFRWRNDAGDARYDHLEAKRLAVPLISVPTLVLHGDVDGASLVDSTKGEGRYFTAEYERRVIAGVGHFIQREKPEAVIDAVLK